MQFFNYIVIEGRYTLSRYEWPSLFEKPMEEKTSYLNVDGLVEHLHENGISISGDEQIRDLINFGYYHGYKGYRSFKPTKTVVPFADFREISATIRYDSELKAILYPKLMFIETALESIIPQKIAEVTKSGTLVSMMNSAIENYQRCDQTLPRSKKTEKQNNFFRLQKDLENSISRAYSKDNPIITHFINNSGRDLPIWALFEILSLGEVETILKDSVFDVREAVSEVFGIEKKDDTNRDFLVVMMKQLRFLRNAVAHNDIVYDIRFKRNDAPKSVYELLRRFGGLPSFQCESIFEYFVLLSWFMKQLGCSKEEITDFLRSYEKATDDYKQKIPSAIQDVTVLKDYNELVSKVILNL